MLWSSSMSSMTSSCMITDGIMSIMLACRVTTLPWAIIDVLGDSAVEGKWVVIGIANGGGGGGGGGGGCPLR